jgi:hypothetical protein
MTWFFVSQRRKLSLTSSRRQQPTIVELTTMNRKMTVPMIVLINSCKPVNLP